MNLDPPAPDPSGGKDVRFGVGSGPRLASVTHDILGDPFWAVYRRGLADAAARYDCTVHHRAPARFSPEEMVEHLEAAIDERPDGLLATVPDAEVVDAPLRKAVELGIPTIAINAADPRPAAERIPYLFYIGADDVTGGETAAARLLAGGTPHAALCVDHYLVDHACHNARCSGFTGGMRAAGVPAAKLRVPGDDHAASVARIRGHLEEHPEIDAICTLGPPGCAAVVEALRDGGRLETVRHASFDLAPAQLEAVRAGELTFTIDSQQYLQGYLGVAFLSLHARHGFLPAGDVLTGPAIVDGTNVEDVVAGVREGVR